jgi:hypothetical protein
MAEEFRFDVTADDEVLLYWPDEPVVVLRGEQARAFLKRIEGVDDPAAQLELAKFVANEIRERRKDDK